MVPVKNTRGGALPPVTAAAAAAGVREPGSQAASAFKEALDPGLVRAQVDAQIDSS